ncbi:hypothetical protein LCGC14_0373350 [marine sediment metagenome]|uniref:dATP/dGTP diphosphohydrolase N-terminal domain-containing protein n=1 Tax=marine sediment metagenome TaxID=412755 RepID=A0A0F9T4G8_9ZZZZ
MSKISEAIVTEGLKQTIADMAKYAGKDLPDPALIPTMDKITPEFSVGDLDSDDVGTGARIGAGKLPVELIPVRCWVAVFRQAGRNRGEWDWSDATLNFCMSALAGFQEGGITGKELLESVPHPWFDEAVEVLAYAIRDGGYREWNWLKGMPWSVPLGCAIRHAKAHILDGECSDKESGLSHIGHFVCNLIMLATFYDTYPEGNDFPDPRFFGND